MKNKKIILYIFFSLVIVVSAVIFFIDANRKEEPEPEIYEPTPSEISVNEEDKSLVTIGTDKVRFAPDIDLDEERRKYNNNEIIGRLEIPDLFNVLVAQSSDNSFYLKHDVSKKYDIRGTEFLDFQITPTSKQVNIYGHNTRDPNIKVAFLKLEKFLDEDYFNNNKYIAFQYDGGKSIYKIKAMKEVYESNLEHLYLKYTGERFLEHVNEMTSGKGLIFSRDVTVNEDSEILVLQTCSHHWDKALYIITAVKVM